MSPFAEHVGTNPPMYSEMVLRNRFEGKRSPPPQFSQITFSLNTEYYRCDRQSRASQANKKTLQNNIWQLYRDIENTQSSAVRIGAENHADCLSPISSISHHTYASYYAYLRVHARIPRYVCRTLFHVWLTLCRIHTQLCALAPPAHCVSARGWVLAIIR